MPLRTRNTKLQSVKHSTDPSCTSDRVMTMITVNPEPSEPVAQGSSAELPQWEEQDPQQYLATINASDAPPESGCVPQFFKLLRINEKQPFRKQKERPIGDDHTRNVVNNSLGRIVVRRDSVLDVEELHAVPIGASTTFEEEEPLKIGDEDEPLEENLTMPDTEESVERLSQRGLAPWILASRELHVARRSLDPEFISQLTARRRQIDGISLTSTSSTVQSRLINPQEFRVSLDSTAHSDLCSIANLPSEVEFPPTPVFRDEIPNMKGLTIKADSNFLAANLVSTPNDSYSFQNSDITGASMASSSRGCVPGPTERVRLGYWNRRGDHLTPDGYIVFPPPHLQYPEDLRMYPSETQGYQDHSGLSIAYVRRPELPQSLSKHGKPPERPYESFVIYI